MIAVYMTMWWKKIGDARSFTESERGIKSNSQAVRPAGVVDSESLTGDRYSSKASTVNRFGRPAAGHSYRSTHSALILTGSQVTFWELL